MNLAKIKPQKSKFFVIFFQSKPTINRTQIQDTLTQWNRVYIYIYIYQNWLQNPNDKLDLEHKSNPKKNKNKTPISKRNWP